MPGLDGTGPNGMGPMTGRGMGQCVISISTHSEKLDYLRKRSEAMTEELRQIQIQINELEKSSRAFGKRVAS
jgi:hypothetical protein